MADSSFRIMRRRRSPSSESSEVAALPFWHYLVAAVLGAANTFSFAPTPHGGWIELVIFALFFAWLSRTSSWKSAALTGWAFGFGNFVTGVWWLYVSMHFYGGMAAPLAAAAVALFSLYLAIYPAAASVVWSLVAGRAQFDDRENDAAEPRFVPTWHGAFAFASAWALGEWLRGLVFTGFPWLSSGYAQVDGPLAGYGAIAGVYGVGWVLALVAALAVQAFYNTRRRVGTASPAARFAPGVVAVALVVAGMLLSLVQWTTPANSPLTVRLLQGNVKQEMKFEQEGVNASLALYRRMITEKPADLIVTPETALPVLAVQVPEDLALALRQFADTTKSSILFGAIGVTITPEGRAKDFTNSLFGITPGSFDVSRYDKHHLVPFGEFVPLGFHWFVNLMGIPLGDLARGPSVQKAFFVHNQPIAVDICYEDIFGEEIAKTLREQVAPAGILVNSTNLAWFGDTIALDQHLQIARMRSIETGRPMLRATNTGMTAVIAANGDVVSKLPTYTTGTLEATVQGTSGRTPYVTSGNLTVIAVSLLLLAFAFAFAPSRKDARGK